MNQPMFLTNPIDFIHRIKIENLEDLANACRTCATVTESVIPIFDGEGLQNSLADKIYQHLSIQVNEYDELPRALCRHCADTLVAWHRMVQCCMRADRELRTRLRQLRSLSPSPSAPPTSPPLSPITTSHLDEQLKVESTGQRLDDNQPDWCKAEGTSLGPQPPSPGRACDYCAHWRSSTTAYKDHLVTAHADLLFHCDECDTYVDRKDLIQHMSSHAVQYAAGSAPASKSPPAGKLAPDTGQVPQSSPLDDAFSDHSNADDSFGPLPDSVFEAIEDSQDSGPPDFCHPTAEPIHQSHWSSLQSPYTTSPHPKTPSPQSVASPPRYVPPQPTSMPPQSTTPPPEHATSPPQPTTVPPQSTTPPSQHATSPPQRTTSPLQSATPPPPILPQPTTPFVKITNRKGEKYNKKNRTCGVCSKTFTAGSSYFYHVKYVHSNVKEYECNECGRRFGTRAYLADHLTVHTGERRFACDRCGKLFRTRASLHIHAQTHADMRPYTCARCARTFGCRQKLTRHELRHAIERAHVCTACGRSFAIRYDLQRHERTHAAPERHACSHCGAVYAQSRYLRVHLNKKHPDTLLPRMLQPSQDALVR